MAFSFGKGISKLDGGLVTIQTAATDYGTQVSELRTEISALKASVTFWLDVASVTLTLILLWLIFSQVVVFILGLSMYRKENLFARWIGGSIYRGGAKVMAADLAALPVTGSSAQACGDATCLTSAYSDRRSDS